MPRRIKLHINPSGYDKGVTWKVYRSTSPENVIAKDNYLMDIDESLVNKEVEFTSGDVLNVSLDDPFLFSAQHRYIMSPTEPIVYLDGVAVDSESVTFFPGEHEIRLVDSRLTIGHTHTITMDYYYLAAQVIDDDRPQDGITYYGHTATGLKPVHNLAKNIDYTLGNVSIEWEHDSSGIEYNYQMLSTVSDKKSEDSETKSIFLDQDTSKIQYRIERAESPTSPEEDWELVTYTSDKSFIDEQLTSDLPFWALKEEILLEKVDSSSVRIRVPNPFYNVDMRKTYAYRIAPADDCGETNGDWEYIFPKEFEGINKAAKVRRYRYNKMPSSYSSIEDGIDIVIWGESETGEYLEYIDTYMDPLEEDLPKEFGYTFYLQDKWEYISQPVYRAISLENGEVLE